MARPRLIDRDAVLNAAEAVVVRDGAAHLTLDAVATEAGISKPSVIYDYKTKQALIRGVIERRTQQEQARVAAEIAKRRGEPNACILGHIAAAAEGIDRDIQAVGVTLCATASQDAELRSLMQDLVQQNLDAVKENSTEPRQAMLAFLALQGLKLFEFLRLYSWPPEERARLLQDIEELVAPAARVESVREAGVCSAG